MFFRRYRKKIAEAVEDKMCYMGTCPNEQEIILSIIAPKDYKRSNISHCENDCWHTECICCKKGLSKRDKLDDI